MIQGREPLHAPRESQRHRYFYGFFVPLGMLANLGLGLFILAGISPLTWPGWLQVGSGALCCVISGWLAATVFSNSYWHRSMERQVATWGRIADAFFKWVEDAPVPAEALHSLRSSLEEAVPSSERR
jgi:hypothetical protein